MGFDLLALPNQALKLTNVDSGTVKLTLLAS